MPLERNCTTEERCLLTIAPTTKKGVPVAIDGPAAIEVVSGDGTFTRTDNPNEIYLNSGDNPGDTVFLIEGDADLGEGVETIADTVTLHVANPFARNLGLGLGANELKPE